MNLQWYNILAADGDGLIGTVIFVALLIFSLIGHVIKKAQEKRQVEEADRKVEESKRRHAAAKISSERAQTEPAPPAIAPPAQVKQQASVIHAATTLGKGVNQEVLQAEKRLVAEQAQQRKRLAGVKRLQPTIGGKAARAERTVADGPKIHLNLTSPKAAKTAIVCAEILGLPKALRSNPEPWDM